MTLAVLAALALLAPPVIEDESKVPPYTLPDPLVLAAGGKVADALAWTSQRRP